MGLSKACSHAEGTREYYGKLRSFTHGGIVSINILIMEARFLTVEERNSTQRKGEI